MKLKIWRTVGAACLLALSAGVAAAATLVPGGSGNLATVEGNTNNFFPFSTSSNGNPYQQIYSSSFFSGPMDISGIAFRRDLISTAAGTIDISNVVISLSTSNNTWDAASNSIASNTGSDSVEVFNGSKSSSFASSGGSGPKPFDFVFNFDNDFSYDPSQGDLAVNISISGFSTSGSIFWDAQQHDASMTRVYGPGNKTDNFGLVTQFTYEEIAPVPLPAAFPLLLAALGGLGFAARRRKTA